MKTISFAIVIIIFACSSCVHKKNTVPPGELDIQAMIQPIPATARFINDTSYIWCGTLLKSHIDRKYHLFYSQWPRKYGMSASVTSSEIAHAITDNPEGPFVKQNKPIFTAENVDFPAEDPYVWYQENCYYAIVKDMKGSFTNAGRSLVLFYSHNGLDWNLAKHPLVSDLNIKWEDGSTKKLEALERPQFFFENGKMVVLLCAVNETQGHSYNVQIPLK